MFFLFFRVRIYFVLGTRPGLSPPSSVFIAGGGLGAAAPMKKRIYPGVVAAGAVGSVGN